MYEWVWVWEVSVGGKCRRVCEVWEWVWKWVWEGVWEWVWTWVWGVCVDGECVCGW